MAVNVSRFITLEHYISKEKDKHPGASGEFTYLLHDLGLAIRRITREVRKAGISDILGLHGSENVHGEEVKKLDVYANDLIIRSMDHGGHLCVLGSEENEEPIPIPDDYNKGKYVLLFDPLDGSSNIEVNVTIGTIFSLYKRVDPNAKTSGSIEDLTQPGYKQIAAGYALYGSSTVFVYTTGQGVHTFTYDPTIGEFLLVNENLKIPDSGNYYSINEANYNKYNKNLQDYLTYLKLEDDKKKAYKLRYIGTGVADLHRTLIYGGIFMYPMDIKNPKGKLRLCYEANPLAMIVEQAGGKASDGKNRILGLKPETIHDRVPLFIGSKNDVTDAEQFLAGQHEYQKTKGS